jgi:hypothetical protein
MRTKAAPKLRLKKQRHLRFYEHSCCIGISPLQQPNNRLYVTASLIDLFLRPQTEGSQRIPL